MTAPRFLIGFGERLTEPIEKPNGNPSGPAPYEVNHARARVGLMLQETAAQADRLPREACPHGLTVATLTLHPRYLSKSGFPSALLQSAGLRHVGSRPRKLVPEQISRKNQITEEVEYFPGTEPKWTTELFVSTSRANLHQWSAHLNSQQPLRTHEEQIVRVEQFGLNNPAQRDRLTGESETAEIVLHSRDEEIIAGLESFCQSLHVNLLLDRRIETESLVFIPASGENDALRRVAEYSFTRVVRAIPRMRRLLTNPPEPVRAVTSEKIILPGEGPVDSSLRVAVFDGGLPKQTVLEPWSTGRTADDDGDPIDSYVEHGHDVTSALLFGSIDPAIPVARPYAHVDHFRVLDTNSLDDDPFELYSVMSRIESVLMQARYPFVSISIGPDLPIEDDEVHAWTAFWDSYLANGETLLTVAIGNNGYLDTASGNARVQVPSDSVNALAIGAANSMGDTWGRASYSAWGPGRDPGVVKPDVVAFGGSTPQPFVCVGPDGYPRVTCGTSFASPLALRTALGVRTLFGNQVTPLALKALLIHTAEPGAEVREVGRGRILHPLSRITTCNDHEARVLYQGTLTARKYLRAAIPVPADLPSSGKLEITATLAYSTQVDPSDPGNYTRSGLEVVFRPHRERFDDVDSQNPSTDPFFTKHKFQTEQELRHDSHKWDTVLHASKIKYFSSIKGPVFDIHFNPRTAGQDVVTQPNIRYAMVITVRSRKIPDLYDQVLRTYATQLQALRPTVDITLTT
ncbi:S8 family peptidase [Mycobacteroides abscessus]|uniref:S8 family peptidase n=1 Tax=Mycobacteroides abscessus TaxID=36809 RepID=UPI000C2600BB|nr:S8 family peptidase [Mycobacteroides abscessus]PVA74077.1 peptidase S8 and S53, subtilisin, kexin, sedolisin [Mycobacteroides abscessus]PVB11554.1 peptidase S8 and S53, subtilisin, kexin, sedolisin [Mycobacteroides abscessus]